MPRLAGLPLVIDMVDVDSLKWRALARRAAPPMRWIYAREAACLARFEASVAPQAYANLVVNEREREALSRLAPDARIDVIQQGIDFMNTLPGRPPRYRWMSCFCGVMNYPPNEEGILWFAAQVWPLVRKRSPQARLRIVGAAPRRNVLALADRDNGIEVTGSVPDMNRTCGRRQFRLLPCLLHVACRSKSSNQCAPDCRPWLLPWWPTAFRRKSSQPVRSRIHARRSRPQSSNGSRFLLMSVELSCSEPILPSSTGPDNCHPSKEFCKLRLQAPERPRARTSTACECAVRRLLTTRNPMSTRPNSTSNVDSPGSTVRRGWRSFAIDPALFVSAGGLRPPRSDRHANTRPDLRCRSAIDHRNRKTRNKEKNGAERQQPSICNHVIHAFSRPGG